MKLLRILTAAIVAVTTVATFSLSAANAAGTYKISCKNEAYGMHLGSDYTQVAYVYNVSARRADAAGGMDTVNYLIGAEYNEAYVGNDCLYAGAADTNGTAVVAADVARLAVGAIVGAVNNRIDMAYAAKNSGASATGLSFTNHGDGVAMSANKIFGGLSFWADYGTSNFENTQAFTNVRLDSMAFDGDAGAYSIGVDKAFGKALVGVLVSNLDVDLKTKFNDGTYKQEIDTYGVYLAYRTSILQIDLGTGVGDSSIDTTRRDLGSDAIINGKTTADVEYSNARISANFSRGRFSLVPSASYRQMSMDIAAFVDDRRDDVSADIVGEGELFGTHSVTTTVTDDSIAARTVDSETMSVGAVLSANLGMLTPYLAFTYDSEDTTRAVYKTEAGTDGNDVETASTNYQSSTTMGGGVNFMFGKVKGGLRAGSINGRDDWEENYVTGNISIGF